MKAARSVRRRAGGKGLLTQYLACGLSYCPGNKESAGKRLKNGITKGNPYLRAVLAEIVWSITRTDTYLAAQYHRIARRKGKRRAVMAVAHSGGVLQSGSSAFDA